MKINFKNIKIDNFLSFGHAELDIDNLGYVLVSGRNTNSADTAVSNGSGKSSLFDAILWALTGETVRGSKDVVNLFGNDGAVVELSFSIDENEFKVVRSKNHSKLKTNLTIEYNGKNVSGKGIRDSEKILEQYLGDLTPSVISSVIILGQGLPQRFTNNTPSARKEILEKLSKSDFMIEDLKEKVLKRKTTLLAHKREYEDSKLKVENTLSIKERELDNLVNNPITEDDIIELKNDIDSCEKIVESTKLEKDATTSQLEFKQLKLDTLTENYNAIHDKYLENSRQIDKEYNNANQELNKDSYNLMFEINSIKKKISDIDNMKDVCPTCGQKLVNFVKPDKTPLVEQQTELESKLSEVNANIAVNKENYSSKKSEIEDTRKREEKGIVENISRIKEETAQLSAQEKKLMDIIWDNQAKISRHKTVVEIKEKQLSTYKSDIENLTAEIEKLKENILYINNDAEEVSDRLDIISNMETALKRDFRGVLLQSVIEYIDSRIKDFSTIVFDGADISFTLDGNAISIKFNGKEYENLSGGEKQKIDLIVQFAIREMLSAQTNFKCNILVLDEIFDNLDSTGSEKVLDLVSAKLYDVENIFIITHHASIPIPYDKEIIIQKGDDNLSVIL